MYNLNNHLSKEQKMRKFDKQFAAIKIHLNCKIYNARGNVKKMTEQ